MSLRFRLSNPKVLQKPLFYHLLLPALSYFIIFSLITYPLITHYTSAFMGDLPDVYQNTWSLWWFQQAADDPSNDLWRTNLVYYPKGESLYGHALTPLNGALAYPLSRFMPWHQVYNTLIIFNFIATGLSLFWLALYYTKAFVPSLLAGGFYTFSTYHFYHSRGHIEMASMQWLTFFIHVFVWLLESPSNKKALLAVFLLFLSLWNTPYHFLYALIAGVILVMPNFWFRRNDSKWIIKATTTLLVFIVGSHLMLGPTLLRLYSFTTYSLTGEHEPVHFSAELFNYFSRPSGILGELTNAYWPELLKDPESNPPRSSEASVRLSLVAFILAGLAVKRFLRQDLRIKLWLVVGSIFLILSLGPVFLYLGKPLRMGEPPSNPLSSKLTFVAFLDETVPVDVVKGIIWLPYAWITYAFPALKLSGVPARMGVMPLMALSVLAAFGIQYLLQRKKYLLIGCFMVVWVLETIPKQVTPLPATVPAIARLLAESPRGALLDRANHRSLAMYYQTWHKQPLIDGYLARVTQENWDYSRNLAISQRGDNLELLCNTYQVKYLWTAIQLDGIRSMYTDQNTYLYDLMPMGACLELEML